MDGFAMNERREKDEEERVWRLCDTVMDANEPDMHASNFGRVLHFWIYARVSILIKFSCLVRDKLIILVEIE